MARNLTTEERAVLAHVVLDPDAWWAHAAAHFGEAEAEAHLAAKVAKHRAAYQAAVATPGYQTRAQREA